MNWEYAGMGDKPRLAVMRPGWIVRDALDVADPRSENAHDYTYKLSGKTYPDIPIPFRRNFGYHEEIDQRWPDVEKEQEELIPQMRREGILNQYDIVDAGRRIDGEESFILRGLLPGHEAYLILRTCDDRGEHESFFYRMEIFVDGRYIGNHSIQGAPWNWYDSVFTVPASAVQNKSIQIRIRNLGSTDSPYYSSYYYWIAQGGRMAVEK